MQDQDAPPVEEGETGGGAVVVPRAVIRMADRVVITSATAFTRHPWITATVRPSQVATAMVPVLATGLVLRRTIRRPNLSHCPCVRMQHRASSASSMISFSKPRFRKL